MRLEISAQVSLGVQGPDVARIHEALVELGRNVPAADAGTRIFGAGTVAVLRAIQTDLGVPATGVVDAATVRIINAALAARPTAPRTVRGQVRTADGRPAAGLFVFLYLQDPDGETGAGQSPLDESGAYKVILDESRLPELEQILRDFKAKTSQEAIYLEIQRDVDVRFI